MNLSRLLLLSTFPLLALENIRASSPTWVPEDLLPPAPPQNTALGAFLTQENGQATLDAALKEFPDRTSWEAYAQHIKMRIQEKAGLAPWPKRTPLNPVFRNRREYDGYSVENVIFEAVPGHLVTGNIFRPLNPTGPSPVFLSTHGHSKGIQNPGDYDNYARFAPGMQTRCANLAKMGVVVLSIDMFGFGDSIQLVGQPAHKQPLALTIQIWNAIRALDLLLSLENIDSSRVGVSGESGGGTQSFLLTALDPRVTLCVPVVMVSSYFFGGCPCESGLPIHRSADHFASNAMIAAMAAPRPMLVVSDGLDWTKHVPTSEFPFLRKIYGYYGAEKNVANVHLPDEGHDYGPSKRSAMLRFVATQFGLNLSLIQDQAGEIDESRVTIERAAALHVFDANFPIPPNALHDAKAVVDVISLLQK